MCDVDNPLCGASGATRTFARQKGATDEMIEELESGMRRYQPLLQEYTAGAALAPGAGAAGGLGAALQVFAHAKMRSGVEMLLDLCRFDEQIADADAVVTGEGRVDWQSAHGKVIWGIAKRCSKQQVPLIALVGSKSGDCKAIFDCGVRKIYALTDYFPLEQALNNAEEAYRSTARCLFSDLKAQFARQ